MHCANCRFESQYLPGLQCVNLEPFDIFGLFPQCLHGAGQEGKRRVIHGNDMFHSEQSDEWPFVLEEKYG